MLSQVLPCGGEVGSSGGACMSYGLSSFKGAYMGEYYRGYYG